MNLNRNNYEVFFIDYHDGALSAEQVAELFLFLEANPDLNEEFNNFQAVSIESSNEIFPERDALKRGEINEQNFSWYMAAAVENDLTVAENKLLENYLQLHPQRNNDVALFHATKLEPTAEVYPNKKALRQPIPFAFNLTRNLNYAIAAILLLSFIAGGYFIYTKSLVHSGSGVAQLPKNEAAPQIIPIEKNNSAATNEPASIANNNSLNNNLPVASTHKVNFEKSQLANTNNKQSNEIEKPATSSNENEVMPLQKTEIELPQIAEAPTIESPKSEPVAATIPANLVSQNDEYLTVWEALCDGAKNNLRKSIKKNKDANNQLADENRIHILDVVSKGVEKISNDKITVDAAYADNGKVANFRFAAGKFSIER
jgi:hypothetical protein